MRTKLNAARTAVQFMAETLFRVEADSEFSMASLPEPECVDLSCDSFSRGVLAAAAAALLACIACLAFNNVTFFVAERAPGLPHALRVRCRSHS